MKFIRKSTLFFLSSLLLTLFAIACSTTNNEGESQLEVETPIIETEAEATAVSPTISFLNGKWALGELIVDDAVVNMPDSSSLFLTIEDDSVSGTTGCNQFSGSAVFDKGSVTFDPLAATLRACLDEEVMAFEAKLLDFYNAATTFSAERDTLKISNDDSSKNATFTRVTEQTLFVGAEQVDCVGVGPQKCLLVKENAADDYSNFYNPIAGFEWEAGHEYELRVEVIHLLNPPADASSLRYELAEVVSQTEVAVAPTISFLNGKWALGELIVDGAVVNMPDSGSQFLTIEDDSVSGTTGCNQFSGSATFDKGDVAFDSLATTRKLCLDDVMTFETALLDMYNTATTFSAERDTLKISNADETTNATFTRVTEQTLFIGAEQVDCVGVGPQKCLLVKENAADDYSNFYNHIAGFEWEAGHEYELRVEVIRVLNPPADASSLRYELVEVVSQTEVAVAPTISFLNGKWALDELVVDGAVKNMPDGNSVFLTIEDDNVSGTTGCNQFSGSAVFDKGNVTFEPLATTLKACLDTDVVAFETALLDMYSTATTFSAERDTLKISNAGETTNATFTRVTE